MQKESWNITKAVGCYSSLLILTYLSQILLMNDEVEMTP